MKIGTVLLFLLAQGAPPPLETPLPAITYVFPAGGQCGRTFDVTVFGTNVVVTDKLENNSAIISGGGVTAKVVEAKEVNRARVTVTIARDAEPGEREFRVLTPGGVSNRYRFMVGQLPEINEVEPNSEKDKPQVLPALPVLINGQITDSDRDYFRFRAKAGETLVLAVQGRALLSYIANAVPGWFDPILTVFDSRGRELQYADDFRFKPDPVMVFKVPADGEYTLELRDVIFRGRPDFVYRLSIGAVPYLTDIFPLGGRLNAEVPVEISGVNLPFESMKVAVPADAPRVRQVSVKKGGLVSSGVKFASGDLPEVREAEPNDQRVQAQRIEFPVVVNGRIDKPGDVDHYVFGAKAGQRLVLEVFARRLDSPLDSMITVFNARGDVLAENDDWNDPNEALVTHHADSRLVFTCPSAADYTVRIKDVPGKGGPEYAYRLSIAPPQPDFAVRIIPDNPRVGAGETTSIAVTAVRKDNFDFDIKLTVEGLPQGFVASEGLIPAGMTESRITITAPANAATGVLAPRVIGTAVVDNRTIRRVAEAAEAVQQAFAYTHNVPTRNLSLAVVKASAYDLSTSVEPGKVFEIAQDTEFPIPVKVRREERAKAGVSVTTIRAANGITVKSVFLAADKDEGTVTLSVTQDARVGVQHNIIVMGVMRSGRETITRYAPAIPIRILPKQQASAK